MTGNENYLPKINMYSFT